MGRATTLGVVLVVCPVCLCLPILSTVLFLMTESSCLHVASCYVSRPPKSLERIFPNGLDMALIVDDRDDVWRGEQAKNLLLVRPYKFFVVSALHRVSNSGYRRLSVNRYR